MKLTNQELDDILTKAGLMLAEPYSPKNSYRKDQWLLTMCTTCGTEAHYRLKYILDKNALPEKTCRACYWLDWYGASHELYDKAVQELIARGASRQDLQDQGIINKETNDMAWSEASQLANDHGLELIDLIHGRQRGDDVLITRCKACGRQQAVRPCDATYGCTCNGTK